MEKKRHILCNGVGLTTVKDKRFKNEFFSINFLCPLYGKENAFAYLLPSVLVRGCEKYDNMQQMNSLLEEAYDAEIGTDTYRTGNVRVIRFSSAWLRWDLTFDGTDPGATVFDLLSNIITKPLKEKDGNLSSRFTELEKESLCDFAGGEKNNKRSYSLNSCLKILLEGDEYAYPKYGSEEDIRAIDNLSLTEFYNKMISLFPVEFYYHGCEEGEKIAELIKKYFAPLFGEKIRLEKGKKRSVSPCQQIKEINEKGDCEQTVVVMGFDLPNTKEDKYALTLLNEILGYSPVSRLFMNVREKRGICYYCDLTTLRYQQASFIVGGIDYKKQQEMKDAVLEQIRDIANNNISPDELITAKNSIINNYLSFFDSPKDHESLVLYSVLGSDYLDFDQYREKILSVSSEQISEMAGKMTLAAIFTLTGK